MKYSKKKCRNYGEECYGKALEGSKYCKKCEIEGSQAEDHGVYHE